jgi:DNA mismatch repair protein MutS2
VERTIKDLKRVSAEAADETARSARQRVEQMAESQRARLEELDAHQARPRERASEGHEGVAVGDLVHVSPLGGRLGRVVETRDEELVIAIGDVKMTFPRPAISRAAVQGPVVEVPVRGDLAEPVVATEIDVRGLRAGEMDEVVMQALDAAIRADLPTLRIIHGKGTGALRERVAEMLRKDTRVRSFRLGAWNEGGTGVTVAEL